MSIPEGGCHWAEKGVIFVDGDEAGREVKERIEERKERGKPIWVIDSRALAIGTLAMGLGVEEQALYVVS